MYKNLNHGVVFSTQEKYKLNRRATPTVGMNLI